MGEVVYVGPDEMDDAGVGGGTVVGPTGRVGTGGIAIVEEAEEDVDGARCNPIVECERVEGEVAALCNMFMAGSNLGAGLGTNPIAGEAYGPCGKSALEYSWIMPRGSIEFEETEDTLLCMGCCIMLCGELERKDVVEDETG